MIAVVIGVVLFVLIVSASIAYLKFFKPKPVIHKHDDDEYYIDDTEEESE